MGDDGCPNQCGPAMVGHGQNSLDPKDLRLMIYLNVIAVCCALTVFRWYSYMHVVLLTHCIRNHSLQLHFNFFDNASPSSGK